MLRTNSPKEIFAEGLLKFKQRLKAGEYLENIIERSLSGVNFDSRQKFKTNIDETLESAFAESTLYKTSDHLFQKGKITLVRGKI